MAKTTDVEAARAKVRDLTKAIEEKRKPSDSRPPTAAVEAAKEVAEVTPSPPRRILGFVVGRNR